MYHYRMRAHNPECGRFLQRDPRGYVDGPSLYLYARTNPVRLRDPMGTQGTDPLVEQYNKEHQAMLDEAAADPEFQTWSDLLDLESALTS